MVYLWDYDIDELKKTEKGRIFILERMINYGVYPSDKEKVKLSDVKKYWNELHIDAPRRRLFKLLIWGS